MYIYLVNSHSLTSKWITKKKKGKKKLIKNWNTKIPRYVLKLIQIFQKEKQI